MKLILRNGLFLFAASGFLVHCGGGSDSAPTLPVPVPFAETLAPAVSLEPLQSLPPAVAAIAPTLPPDAPAMTPPDDAAKSLTRDKLLVTPLVTPEEQKQLKDLYQKIFVKGDSATYAEAAVGRFILRIEFVIRDTSHPAELTHTLETLKALETAVKEAWQRTPDRRLVAYRNAFKAGMHEVVTRFGELVATINSGNGPETTEWNDAVVRLQESLKPWRPIPIITGVGGSTR